MAKLSEPRRQGLAFGLTLDCGYDLLGVAGGAPTTRGVRLDLVGEEATPRPGAQRLASAAGLSVDRDDEGYVFTAPELGVHRVSPAGDAVLSAPPPGAEPERWQQLVTGQALPLAAVLQGLEPIHASAVVSDGAALAFTAPSRGGKSAVCAAMVRRGAGFLTDDVLTLEAGAAGGLLAHAGPALATLDGTRAAVKRHEPPVPLGAVYVLEGGPTDTVVVERMPRGDPRALLGATFNAIVTDPGRLERHLEVCARMTACPLLRVLLPAGVPLQRKTADAVASAVMRI